ncbi:MAG: DHH family phosphoesterase, partial [Bacilli bacterium]|nr:DHH family phosphoesterase [Bacilli bacterium]
MTLFDKLLTYYHISQKDFAILSREANDGDVPNYRAFMEIEIAKTRIKKAIDTNEKILVYGDYDADGILATSILVRTLKKLNAEVDYYVPSRYLDGYGISEEKVIKAHEQGYTLIITVDNGVTAFAAIKKAQELKLDLIITDHHEYQSRPDALAFLHPKASSLKVTTSGAMTAFYLSYALLEEIDPYLLIMGATSILSDVMPLREENRFIVKLALKYLNKNKYDQFNLLSGAYTYDETTLNSLVIPKINAVGRIEQGKEVNVLVKYFVSDNYRDLVKIRDYVNEVNEHRKDLASNALQASVDITKACVCLKLDCLIGLSGLIANRFLMAHDKPAAIFAQDLKDGYIRGSLRSKNGCNVMDFINQNKNLFNEFGGHAFAAGVVIK